MPKGPRRAARKPRSAKAARARRLPAYSLDAIEDQEISALVGLTRRAYRVPHREGTLITKVSEDEHSIRKDLARGISVIVARQRGARPTLLGAIRLIEDRGALFFSRLAVAPAARGLGLGAALVGAAESMARAWGMDEVRCDVALGKHLVGFYERLGYDVDQEYVGLGGLGMAQLLKRL